MNAISVTFFFFRPMNMFLSLYPAFLRVIDPLHTTHRLVNDLLINQEVDWVECIKIRANMLSYSEQITSIGFPNFNFELMPSYLKYLRERNILVAIPFEVDSCGLLRKYKKQYSPRLVDNPRHTSEIAEVFLPSFLTFTLNSYFCSNLTFFNAYSPFHYLIMKKPTLPDSTRTKLYLLTATSPKINHNWIKLENNYTELYPVIIFLTP